METMARWFSFRFTKNSWVKPHYLLLILIVGIAAFFRLYKIADYMTFLGDEGRDVLIVYDILHGKFTLLGPTASVGGFFLGPLYYYLMAPFLWVFNYNPVGPAVMVAILGVVTVWFVYKAGSELFNIRTGLAAASLYAIAPLVVAYSRSSWNPNLMPLFSLLTLYCLYKATVKKNSKFFVLSGIFLGSAMQLHYLTVFLGIIVGFYVLITKMKDIYGMVRAYIFLFIGFILGWSLFLAFEVRHNFPNIQSISNFILHSGETGSNEKMLPIIKDVFFRLFARLTTNYPPSEQIAAGMHPNITLWYYATLTLSIGSAMFFLLLFFRSIKTNKHDFYKYSLLFIWLILGIGLFGFYKKPIYDYYLGFMFPLPFFLIGNFIASLSTGLSGVLKISKQYQSSVNNIGKVVAVSILLLLFAINLQGIPFRHAPNKQKDQVRSIAEFVLGKTDGKPFNFALITQRNSDHAYRYFFRLKEINPIVIQNSQIDPLRKSVTNQLLIVCEDPACQPLGNSLWEVAGFGRAEIAGEWDVSVVKVYKLVHYKGK